MSLFKSIPVLFCVVANGCVSVERNHADRAITPVDVNLSPEKFNGQRISVEGYLTLRRESHVIFQSKDLVMELKAKIDGGHDFEIGDYSEFCVTVLVSQGFKVSNKMRDGMNAVVTGVFRDNYLDGSTIDIGACPTKGALEILYVREKMDP
ncbi:MAG: hypothetical protein J0L88_05295 [Xanthomonadales bacterium]|nr:hypothetical protein [Xanthomonadales bacterium]